MRIEVLERMPGEAQLPHGHRPGLGVWRGSAPGVKIYRYLKQVTEPRGARPSTAASCASAG